MTPLLNYVIQVIIVSGLLYSYYHWVLRNKKFHHYNRYYLLGAALLSILIPLINIPVYFTEEQTASSFVYSTLTVFSGSGEEEGVTLYASIPEKSNWFTWDHILPLIYITVAAIVFLRIVFSLLKIRRIIRRHPVEKIDQIRFLNTDEPGTPYSFFRWLFWNRKIELNSVKGEQIFRHELFHIEQKHSLDILFFELLTVAGWFNPFFHLMKKETRAIHEFLADQFAITENNRWDYAELLLMQVLNTDQRLVHPFFHNQIKRRIAMITSPQKTSHQYLRKLMVLPVTALAVMLFAFSYKNSSPDPLSAKDSLPSDEIQLGQQITEQSDTSGKPDQKLKKEVKKLSSGTIISSDSIIYKSVDAGTTDPAYTPILIVNGERVFESTLKDKVILADKVISYSAGDNEAIRLYGKAARHGVLVFYNAKISDAEIKDVKPGTKKVFDKVEIEAAYPGGMDAWRKYLERNLNSQVPIMGKAPAGVYTVVIQFIVNLDGSVSDAKALTKHGYGMEGEAIRAIVKGGNWLPAIQNGRQVNSYRKQPITFVVDEGPKKEGKVMPAEGKMLNEVVMVGYSDTKNTTDDSKSSLFQKVETEAEFPGGIEKWREYLQKNCRSTVATDSGAPTGKYAVMIQFVVSKEGEVSNIIPLTRHGYGMEQEVVRIIKEGPKWKPAEQNGRTVTAYKKQIVTFVVSDDDNEPKESKTGSVREITSNQLNSMNLAELLGVSTNTDVKSFDISVEKTNGITIRLKNKGSKLNTGYRDILQEYSPGKMIYLENILINDNGQDKKLPARVYKVVI
jgi:hypothetical protein